jgi:hypothetical protein
MAVPPRGVVAAFNEIFAVSGLQCRPQFVWLADAGGSIGFAAGGLVAIGAWDLEQLVNRVWARFRHVPIHMIPIFRAMNPNIQLATRSDLWSACLRFTIAHELGHLWQHEENIVVDDLDNESNSDWFGGMIAQALDWDIRLGEIIAHSLGCVDAYCAHPHPDVRVASYKNGRTYYWRETLLAG